MTKYKHKVSIDGFIIGLLLLLIVISPISLVVSSYINGFGLVKDIICIIICFLSLFKMLSGQEICVNKIVLLLVLFVFVLTMSIVLDVQLTFFEKLNSFRYRCEYPITFLLVSMGLTITKESFDDFEYSILKGIVLIGLAISIIAVIELLNPNILKLFYPNGVTQHTKVILGNSTYRRLLSIMGNPINLGFQMCVSFGASVHLIINRKTNASGAIYFLFSFLFAFVLFFTYSRISYLSLCGILFVIVVFVFSHYRNKIRDNRKMFIFLSLLILFVICAFFIMNPEMLIRISKISIKSFLENGRFERAEKAFTDVGPLELLFGHGLGTLNLDDRQYVFEFGFASLLYETGIIGLLSLILFLAILVHKTIREITKMKDFGETIIIPLAIVVGFVLAMIGEDVYAQYPYNFYFWLCVFLVLKGSEVYDRHNLNKNKEQ